jgi:hypothetical protein
LTALLAALTQFVDSHSAGTTAGAATPATASPAATSPGAASPAATAGTAAPVSAAASGVSSTGGTSTGTAPSTLPQDLQAFLHDLFGALRREGHHRHGGGEARPSQAPPASLSSTPAPTPVVGSAVATYGRRGITTELAALIDDLGAGSSAAGTLAGLNTAFTKLIGDLGGTAGTAANDTSGLQSFLASLLQNLQGSSGIAAGALGNGVNVTA